eukprot:SAG11_NODE_20194_length_450_cov_5.319088_1_plen_43_part_01
MHPHTRTHTHGTAYVEDKTSPTYSHALSRPHASAHLQRGDHVG